MSTPRFPEDPTDYDLPPHTDLQSAGGCGFFATAPLLCVCVVDR